MNTELSTNLLLWEYPTIQYMHIHTMEGKKTKSFVRSYIRKVLTNTLNMAATLSGNILVLPWSWGTVDGKLVWFVDGDEYITSAIYDSAFEFGNAESWRKGMKIFKTKANKEQWRHHNQNQNISAPFYSWQMLVELLLHHSVVLFPMPSLYQSPFQ